MDLEIYDNPIGCQNWKGLREWDQPHPFTHEDTEAQRGEQSAQGHTATGGQHCTCCVTEDEPASGRVLWLPCSSPSLILALVVAPGGDLGSYWFKAT